MLENISTQELVAEVGRRKKLFEKGKPKKLKKPDFSNLACACDNYIDGIHKKAINAESFDEVYLKQMIFETAIEAVYKDDVWDWIDECGY